jgi:hypothetical protein
MPLFMLYAEKFMKITLYLLQKLYDINILVNLQIFNEEG